MQADKQIKYETRQILATDNPGGYNNFNNTGNISLRRQTLSKERVTVI